MPKELNNNQHFKKSQGHGGKRPGAGRPAGARQKLLIRDFINEEDARKLVEKVKMLANKGDVTLLKFLVEQVFGKAPQSIDLNGEILKGELTDEQLDRIINERTKRQSSTEDSK